MLKLSETKLPKEVFNAEVNMNLLAQANHVQNSREHVGLRNTKTRSEVNRTTKKVYKQKGTGGARHGSRRANLFVGGGIVFGPRPLKRVLSLSWGMAQAAKIAAFSVKNKAKEIQVVGGLSKITKTKEVSDFLKTLKAGRVTVLLSENSKTALKYLRNIKDVKGLLYRNITARQILQGGMILIDEEALITRAESLKPEANSKSENKAETKKSVIKNKK